MAWTLRGAGAQNSATATTVALAPSATTVAGDMLICNLFVGGNETITMPSGWLLAGTFEAAGSGASSAYTYVYYYPANPGGISSVTVSASASVALEGAITAFTPPTAGEVGIVSAMGGAIGAAVSSLAVASTVGSAATGDLAIAAFGNYVSTAATVAWTTPTGYTLANDATASATVHSAMFYNLSATSGAQSVTGAVATSQTEFSGIVVTFTPVPVSTNINAFGDPLNTTTLNATNWTQSTAGGNTNTPTTGGYEMTYPASATTSSASLLQSQSAYTLGSSVFQCYVAGVPSSADSGVYSYIQLSSNACNSIKFLIEGGTLTGQKVNGNSGTVSVFSVTWNATTMAWLRIRETSGTVYFETAPDGTNWTVQGSLADPFPLTALYASFATGTTSAYTSPGTFQFGFVNYWAVVPLQVVQTHSVADLNGYTPGTVAPSNTAGNALIAVVGIGSGNNLDQAPKSFIADGRNWWNLVASTYDDKPGSARRLDIWVCENASAVAEITIGSTQTYAGLAATVIEVENFPTYTDLNMSVSDQTNTSNAYGILSDSPYGWWPLEDSAITSGLVDMSGNGNSLSAVSLTPNSQVHLPLTSSAMSFDGNKGAAGSAMMSFGATVSWEIWINVKNRRQEGQSRLMGSGSPQTAGTYANEGSEIYLGKDRRLHFAVGQGSGGTSVIHGRVVPRTGWTHLVATAGSGTMNLYQDGVLTATGSYSGTLTHPAGLFTIGDGITYTGDHFNGLAAQAACYNTAISATRVSNHYSMGTRQITGSLTLTGTPGDSQSFVLTACALFGDPGDTIVYPNNFIPVATESTGSTLTDMSSVNVAVAIQSANVTNVAQSATWKWTNGAYVSGHMVAFNAIPAPPAQPGSNVPNVKVEAAFGYQPGSSSGSPLLWNYSGNATVGGSGSWTDITARAIGESGETVLDSTRGKDFELTDAQAGTLALQLNNQDGAFNPQNTASPYYPYVLPETPVRASLVWHGKRYGLGYSYANTFPQNFPHRQWGFSQYAGKDIIGITSQGSMGSALNGEQWSDQAYAIFPLGEYYNNASGMYFSNVARWNSKPAVGYSPASLGNPSTANGNWELETGQEIGIAGDPNSGTGMSGIASSSVTTGYAGSGVIYEDWALPSLDHCTFELWTSGGGGTYSAGPFTGKTVTLLAAYSNPFNYCPPNTLTGANLVINCENQSGELAFEVILNGTNGANIITQTFVVPGTIPSNNLYHVVVTTSYNAAAGIYYLTLWLNGVAETTISGSATDFLQPKALVMGPVPYYGGQAFVSNYALGNVAVYDSVLTNQRIVQHYNTGNTASSGDSLATRIGKLLQWSMLGVPVGVTPELNNIAWPRLGNADQISGQALQDAYNAVAVEEGGMVYAPATANGEVYYRSRSSFYNQSSRQTFGDNPDVSFNPNPSFSKMLGWSVVSSGNAATAADAADATAPGDHSTTVTQNSGNASSLSYIGLSDFQVTPGGYWLGIPVTPGVTYKIEGYVKSVSLPPTGYYNIVASFWEDAGGTITGLGAYTSTATFLPGGGQWRYISATFTAPAGSTNMQFGPQANLTSASSVWQAADFWAIPQNTEIPYDAGTGFDYSDTYIYNIVQSQRTISEGNTYYSGGVQQQQPNSNGVDAQVNNETSIGQYFPRGPLQLPVETTQDQDAFDRANWALAKYAQPQVRANQVIVDLASNPEMIAAVMGLEQGDIVTVNRRPAGYAQIISLQCVIQMIEVTMGPDAFTVTFTMSPYFPDGAVLQADLAGFDTLGSNVLAW